MTDTKRTLIEYRNDRNLAAILAAKAPSQLRPPPPEIADTGKVRLGSGSITASFPQPTEFQAKLTARKEQRFAEIMRRIRPWDRTRKPGCATMRTPDHRGLLRQLEDAKWNAMVQL